MVVMPEETYIGALANNGVQDIRAHTSACLVQVQEQIHIMHSTRSH